MTQRKETQQEYREMFDKETVQGKKSLKKGIRQSLMVSKCCIALEVRHVSVEGDCVWWRKTRGEHMQRKVIRTSGRVVFIEGVI